MNLKVRLEYLMGFHEGLPVQRTGDLVVQTYWKPTAH
jgi:hypothetical protein